MKESLKIFIFSVFGIITIAACTKSGSSNYSPYSMTATDDGVSVAISGQSIVSSSVHGQMLELTAENTAGIDAKGFFFSVANFTGIGSYTLDSTGNVALYYAENRPVIRSTSGTLIITSATSPAIKGTFSFSDGTTSITNGRFTARF